MISNRFRMQKGMSLVTLLVTLSIFSGIFLTINQWTANQRKTGIKAYQRYQAVQIAENQKQRQFSGLPCEQRVKQNQLTFEIQCSADKVKVRYFFNKESIEL